MTAPICIPHSPSILTRLPPRPLHIRPAAIALVGLGGLVGATARYQLDVLFPEDAGRWPVTTFAINVVGALLLGLLLDGLTRLGPDIGWSQRVRLCIGTGILGPFTIYSTFAVGAALLLREHHPLIAATYVAATVIIGSLLLGLLTGLALFHGLPNAVLLIIGVGFCGAYTTFSIASFETVRLFQQQRYAAGAANTIGAALVALLAGGVGLALAGM